MHGESRITLSRGKLHDTDAIMPLKFPAARKLWDDGKKLLSRHWTDIHLPTVSAFREATGFVDGEETAMGRAGKRYRA
jgi:hypothetical protein